jgi:hypothetical protein
MTRRVSIELVRREFRLSITRRATPADEPGTASRDKTEVPVIRPQLTECPACGSPWFVVSTGDGEDPAIVQRALEKHGIHTLLSPASELLVCGRSFELHTGAFDVTDAASTEPRRRGELPPGESRS